MMPSLPLPTTPKEPAPSAHQQRAPPKQGRASPGNRAANSQAVDVEIERKSKASRAELKVIRDLAHDLQRFAEILRESRGDLHLTPEAVEHVVRAALKLAFNKDLTSVKGPADFQAPCFRIHELPGTWAAAQNNGLYHSITLKELPVTFDRDAAAERTGVVLLHLGHSPVQMCLQPQLTSEIPAYLDKIESGPLERLRLAWSEVTEAPDTLTPAWTDLVLREFLGYTGQVLGEGTSVVRGRVQHA